MQYRPFLLVIATLGPACLPMANNAGEVGPISGSSDGETMDEATTSADMASSTSGDTGSGSDTGADSGSTTAAGLDDPCFAFPPDACPDGCSPRTTFGQRKDSCGVDYSDQLELCVEIGAPVGNRSTTFYAEIDGELRLVLQHEDECGGMGPFSEPAGFTECSGAPEDPEPCHCLCGLQGCPDDDDLIALAACGLPSPCGDVQMNDSNLASTYDLCVLAGLRDRIPGAYGSYLLGLSTDQSHVFLFGGDEAQLVHKATNDVCNDGPDTWDATRRCTLQPPEWFDACMNDPMLQQTCLFGESWFESCEGEPASCG
jgi:hypothetical protein